MDAIEPSYAIAIDEWRNTFKQNPDKNAIGFQFIDPERNFTIKEYEIDV